jgi:hypothetical protein
MTWKRKENTTNRLTTRRSLRAKDECDIESSPADFTSFSIYPTIHSNPHLKFHHFIFGANINDSEFGRPGCNMIARLADSTHGIKL